ncbi:MAG: exopolysaccharide biosynthesis protein, partial [Rhizobiaceae bacterium]
IPGPFGLVFGFCLALVSLQVLFGAKQLWLPQQLRAMKVDGGMLKSGIGHATRWLRWSEKWLKPRRGPQWVLNHIRPAAGLPVLILALIIAIPIPFGNIVPCVALLFLALGLIAEDGLAVAVGLGIGLVACLWTMFLFFAGSSLASSMLSMAGWL